ncbi:AAA family ATPase [Paucibacter sp. AS339]|uniref:ExeA family protein n=1 Tax=Paucibacter hankyongi TaxID=3133434 RepID=UPI0030B37393
MYANFFGLKQEPFSIAPDPHYLYMSERHREALAHLLYGLRGGGGFVLLTGEIGTGKTTVCRAFLAQTPKRCNVAYIFNPKLSVSELLHTVCEEYGIQHHQALPKQGEAATSVKPFVDALNEFLLRTHAVGQNNILIIDEAQNLSAEVLEQLRLLTNLETHERKLLQIILIGQPELRDMLARPELEQLSQRVIARFHLPALSEAETAHYVRHRMGVAGFSAALPFDAKSLRRVHQLARGVPRRINLLCDRALLGAYAQGRPQIDTRTIDRAAAEVFGPQDVPGPWYSRKAMVWGGAGLTALIGLAALGWAWQDRIPSAMPSQLNSKLSGAASGTAAAEKPAVKDVPALAASSTAATLAAQPAATEAALNNSLGLRSEAQAWQELARAWHAEAPEQDPCQALARQQLQCFRSLKAAAGEGGLSLLRLLNRPSLLTLRDEAGRPFYVLLQSLDEQSAVVRLGEKTEHITLLALSTQWRGEFATLWRSPPGYMAKGPSSALQPWVREQLDKVFGPAAASEAATLKQRLAAFQRSQGLRGDGQTGPVTLMLLSRVAGVDEPMLKPSSRLAPQAASAARQ